MQIKKSERFSKIFTGMIMMLLMFLFTAVTSYAAEERSKDVVYTAMLNTSLSDHSGDGSKENPYNRFEDALANVSDGGIIYILSAGAFVNDPGNDNPLVIDKAVTIKPAEGLTRASLENRAAGTVLGADVTFSNIEFVFTNKYHAQIFANGHSLTLNNITRRQNARLIDVVAGGLYNLSGVQLGPNSGNSAQVLIQGTESEFGNIYAGSINGNYYGDASIHVQNTATKMRVNVYGCGAKEAEFDRDDFMNMAEPPSPSADPDKYTVGGKVSVILEKTYIPAVDGAGASKGTEVTYKGTEYLMDGLSLSNIGKLYVEKGNLKPKALTSPNSQRINLAIAADSILNLSNYANIAVNDFNGGGKLILGKNAVMDVSGDLTGKTVFEVSGGYGGTSGMATENHAYIKCRPDTGGTFTFTPNYAQEYLGFVKQANGDWMAVRNGQAMVSIGYQPDDTKKGNVSIQGEKIDSKNGSPQGSAANEEKGYHFQKWTDESGNTVGTDRHFIPQKTAAGVYEQMTYTANFAPNTYKVAFKANGGSGTEMKQQQFVYGTEQKLSRNTYTRQNYTFAGWALKSDGSIAYKDGVNVKNITAKDGETVILYARWTKNPDVPVQTGWQKIGGKWYYLDSKGKKQTGWVAVGGKWYYLNGSGVMQTGWAAVGGKWYYLDGSGAMRTGWIAVGGKWYYLNGSGAMQTGWLAVGGKWYYLNGSGVMQRGWAAVGGKWYYLNGSGVMQTGWVAVGGKWYYLNGSGVMQTGWYKVGGKWYYSYSSGVMAVSTWIGSCYVNGSGVWIK